MNCNSERKSEVQRNDVNEIMDKLAIQYCTDNIRYFPYFEQSFVPAHIWFQKDYKRYLVYVKDIEILFIGYKF